MLISTIVLAVLLGSGVAAWAEMSGSNAGYRMAEVTRADIATSLTVVGNVEPVDQANASFQVAGQVATVTVAPGQAVTAGETLGTLDTTALNETVSSDESTVNADEARLTEDEAAQSSTASSSTSSSTGNGGTAGGATKSSPQTSTTTTAPSSGGTKGGQNATIVKDQATLTQDEATLNSDQQKQAADLAQAQTDCTSTNTGTPAGQAACESALETVSADEQQVSNDQTVVSKDEATLDQALTGQSGSSGNPGTGHAPTTSAVTSSVDSSGATATATAHAVLTAAISNEPGTGTLGASSGAGASGSGSTDADTPEQIASDQSAIDSAEADLINADQSLKEATLTSPIDGTVVSVGIVVGDTVSANSSAETIAVVTTNSYEAEATLDSSQIPSVKVGQSASVEVDGVSGALGATVSQVGPVESSTSGYSYPVVVALPSTGKGLYAGSSADITLSTGKVSDAVAVPTSAVQSLGSGAYVLQLDKGTLTRRIIKVGMVGGEYTQVLSGLVPGQRVVLADYAESVPSSSTNTTGGLGNLLGGGGSGFFRVGGFPGGGGGGGGGGFVQRFTAGGG